MYHDSSDALSKMLATNDTQVSVRLKASVDLFFHKKMFYSLHSDGGYWFKVRRRHGIKSLKSLFGTVLKKDLSEYREWGQ